MKKVSVITVFMVIIFLILGIWFTQQPWKVEEKVRVMHPSITNTSQRLSEVIYTGDLPCADCEGIDVILTLQKDGIYSMSSTYRGRDIAPYIERGMWAVRKGMSTDPQATIYELRSETGENQYYVVDGDKLVQLDQEMNRIEAPFETTLIRREYQ